MPEEIFILIISLVAIVFGCLTVMSIVQNALKYKSKQRSWQEKDGASMTASELQAMLRTVVEEATRPLAAKIDALEERLDAEPRRLDAHGEAWLAEADEVPDEGLLAARRRVR